MEFVAFRWECLLKIISHGQHETNVQAIDNVLLSRPYKLSIGSSVLKSKLSSFHNYYRKNVQATEFATNLLHDRGEVKLALFRKDV